MYYLFLLYLCRFFTNGAGILGEVAFSNYGLLENLCISSVLYVNLELLMQCS